MGAAPDPEGPTPDEYNGDRIARPYSAVTCALVRAGASDAQIAGILLNPELPIHAHIADQKGHGPRAYVARQIERAREWTKKGHEAKDGGTPEPEPPRPLTRPAEPATPYPVDELGDLLGGAARAIHDKVQAPLAICGTAVLAAAALATQGFADVVLPTGQRRPLSLYFVSIAATGERKTCTDHEALAPVEERERELRARPRSRPGRPTKSPLAAWKAERQAILADKKLKGRRRQGGRAEGPRPDAGGAAGADADRTRADLRGPVPAARDGPPERRRVLGRGRAVHRRARHERRQQAEDRGRPVRPVGQGASVKRLRAGDGAVILPGRRVSLHLMAQPDVAELLLGDPLLAEQGLLSRLLVTAPDTMAGQRRWREPKPESDAALARYQRTCSAILRRPLPPRVDERPASPSRTSSHPRALPLSAEARALWIELADHCERRWRRAASSSRSGRTPTSCPEQAARVAGVLALVDDLDGGRDRRGAPRAGDRDRRSTTPRRPLRLARAGAVRRPTSASRSACWTG